jgi:hypothetical protein
VGGIDIRSSESSILLVIALDSAQPDDLQESAQGSQLSWLNIFRQVCGSETRPVSNPDRENAKGPLMRLVCRISGP